MPSEQWPQVERILESAIACDPAGRAAFLDAACKDDTELRREVESLLAYHEDESFARNSGFADGILDYRPPVGKRHGWKASAPVPA